MFVKSKVLNTLILNRLPCQQKIIKKGVFCRTKMNKHKREEKRDKEKEHSPIFLGIGFAVVCFVLFIGIGVASTTDYYVSLSGNDANNGTTLDTAWRTWDHAASTAVAGDTVLIVDGNYGAEHVVIDHSGTAGNPIIFKAYNGTPKIAGDGTGYGITVVGKNYITLDGLNISNYGVGIWGGYGEPLNNHLIIKNCTVVFNTDGICGSWKNSLFEYSDVRGNSGHVGFVQYYGENNIYQYNTVENLGKDQDYGIAINHGKNEHILHNTVDGTGEPELGHHGIVLGKDGEVLGAVVEYNVMYKAGIDIWNSNNVIVRYNTFDVKGSIGYSTAILLPGIPGNDPLGKKGNKDCIWYNNTIKSPYYATFNIFASQNENVTIKDHLLENISEGTLFYFSSYGGRQPSGGVFENIALKNINITSGWGHVRIEDSPSDTNILRNINWDNAKFRFHYTNDRITIEDTHNRYFECSNAAYNPKYYPTKAYVSPAAPSNDFIIYYTTYEDFSLIPSSDYLYDVKIIDWNSTYRKWNESCDNPSITTQIAHKGLKPNTVFEVRYYHQADDSLIRSDTSLVSDSEGYLTYTYTGGYSDLYAILQEGESAATGTISGTVTDKDTGNLIEGATVTANGYSTTTNTTGQYTLLNIPVGTYIVEVSATGYQSQSQTNVQVLDGQTTTADFQLTEVSDLIGEWHFDEGTGTTAYDSSEYGNNGTINGATWTSEGKLGSALEFDGLDDYIEVSNDASLNTQTLTLMAWIKPFQSNTLSPTLFMRETSTGDNLFIARAGIKSDGSSVGVSCEWPPQRWSASYDFQAGQWYHVVALIDGNQRQVYVNDEFIDENIAPNKLDYSDPGRFFIAQDQDGASATDFFKGTIDEVKIYNRALSAEEILAHYEAGVNSTYPRYDVNEDGTVDILDTTIVGQHFGETTNPSYPRCDVNEDGKVDILDITVVGQHLGEITSQAGEEY